MITRPGDGSVASVTSHLDAARFLAADRAWAGPDGLTSAWADTTWTITLALTGLTPHLSGPVEPVEHPDCRSALLAAAQELAQLARGGELPAGDLLSLLEALVPALPHVCPRANSPTADTSPGSPARQPPGAQDHPDGHRS